jgi:hypothetical protein
MKIFYKIAGIVFVFGNMLLLNHSYKEIRTSRTGYFINAKVIFVPNCFANSRHYNIKFEYNGKTYVKSIGFGSCKELNEGDVIRLKTNIENDVFLYEFENPYTNTISFGILLIFGFYLLFMGFKK